MQKELTKKDQLNSFLLYLNKMDLYNEFVNVFENGITFKLAQKFIIKCHSISLFHILSQIFSLPKKRILSICNSEISNVFLIFSIKKFKLSESQYFIKSIKLYESKSVFLISLHNFFSIYSKFFFKRPSSKFINNAGKEL